VRYVFVEELLLAPAESAITSVEDVSDEGYL